jgi:hypothetical protein
MTARPQRIHLRWVILFLWAAGCNLGVPNRMPAIPANTISPLAVVPSLTPTAPATASAAALLASPTIQPTCSSTRAEPPNEGKTLSLCVLNTGDGMTIPAEAGAPVHIIVRASGVAVDSIALSVDLGDTTFFERNPEKKDPFQVDFAWVPKAGARSYSLRLDTLTLDKSATLTMAIHVNIVGMASITNTPVLAAGEVPETIRAKISAAFRDEFGLVIPSPVIARKYIVGVENPWISVAYVADTFYEVDVYDDRTDVWTTPLFPNTNLDVKRSLTSAPYCRPAGVYKMLVVFLDYGNLNIQREEVLSDLAAATALANRAYAQYKSPGAVPIFQLQTTGVVIPPPADLKKLTLTPDMVSRYTGQDITQYAWLAQVDLDANNTARKAWGGESMTSYGVAWEGCPAVRSNNIVNAYLSIDDKREMTGNDRLSGTLLVHEVLHLFGYPGSHIWPCIDRQNGNDQMQACGLNSIPALLLGWKDTDGDGMPEILDSTPYGMTLGSLPSK